MMDGEGLGVESLPRERAREREKRRKCSQNPENKQQTARAERERV